MVILHDELVIRCKCGRYRPTCVCEKQQSAKVRMTARLKREIAFRRVFRRVK